MKRLHTARQGVCTDCEVFKRLYGQNDCYSCYRAKRKLALLSHNIQIPKRLGMRPKHWSFELLEKAWVNK